SVRANSEGFEGDCIILRWCSPSFATDSGQRQRPHEALTAKFPGWAIAMPKLLGRHAIVVGAGIGGLVAAKALSSYFRKVTVLERDALPSRPTARTDTPQAPQIHVLLRGGLDVLGEFFPQFETELERAGAVRVRVGSQSLLEIPGFDPFPRRDLGFDYLCMTRPLVEFVARCLVEQQGNIALKSRCRVTQFLADDGAVTGVRYEEAAQGHLASQCNGDAWRTHAGERCRLYRLCRHL